MKKVLKITESQYSRIFLNEEVLRETESLLNEQTNTPKEYDCIVEKYGDKGKVIQFDKRKSYIIRNNNNDRLYFLEDKSFFHVKKGQGWKTEGQYSCADKKYKIKDKEGDLFTYIDNFLKSPTRLPEPAPSDDSDDDADYSGCVKGTYLEGVVKAIKQTPITGLERVSDPQFLKKPNLSGCKVCYRHSKYRIDTTICFYEEKQIYYVETTTKNKNRKFIPNQTLLSQFITNPIDSVSYISYIGGWDTDDVFVGDIQKITLKIGQIKLLQVIKDSDYEKLNVKMASIYKPYNVFDVLFGEYITDNKSIKPSEPIPIGGDSLKFYKEIYDLVKTSFGSTDTKDLVIALEKIKTKFNNWSEFDNFEYDVKNSKEPSITKLIIDNTTYVDSHWVNVIKPKLQNILTGKSSWDTLPSVIQEIKNHFGV
jgi:hypothetical protein